MFKSGDKVIITEDFFDRRYSIRNGASAIYNKCDGSKMHEHEVLILGRFIDGRYIGDENIWVYSVELNTIEVRNDKLNMLLDV